jgi:GNAT superfamily N-acetyltransferase
MIKLQEISADVFAKEVLPKSAELWARRAGPVAYVAKNLELARSPFGRRHLRAVGLYEGKTLLSSFKRFDRAMHEGSKRLHAYGIASVFTPKTLRGRGYASAMLGMSLDRARAEGYDVAYLFSDIGTPFYEQLGFRALPSREVVLRADVLPSRRLALAPLTEDDWGGVRRCYDLCERSQPAGFVRSPLVWDWIRMVRRNQSVVAKGQETNLIVRRGRAVVAYVLGSRVASSDTYELDEYGFADTEAARLIPALLRAAAGDLRRISGWLPPANAREAIPRGSVRKRRTAILMFAPLSKAGRNLMQTFASMPGADLCWEHDHI